MKSVQRDLESVVQSLLHHYGRKIAAVALFGSAARGEEDERSDLDFLVIVRGLPWRLERRDWIMGTMKSSCFPTMPGIRWMVKLASSSTVMERRG